MTVWKMIFLFQGCILRFYVNLPGCIFICLYLYTEPTNILLRTLSGTPTATAWSAMTAFTSLALLVFQGPSSSTPRNLGWKGGEWKLENNDLTCFWVRYVKNTLQGINISHIGKRKIIFKMPFLGDMLVPWRVYCKNEIDAKKRHK